MSSVTRLVKGRGRFQTQAVWPQNPDLISKVKFLGLLCIPQRDDSPSWWGFSSLLHSLMQQICVMSRICNVVTLRTLPREILIGYYNQFHYSNEKTTFGEAVMRLVQEVSSRVRIPTGPWSIYTFLPHPMAQSLTGRNSSHPVYTDLLGKPATRGPGPCSLLH